MQVSQIMSRPPKTLSPHERAETIVEILRETNHHGFPIVCPETSKFMGLVRRDQLVALIEHNVFDNDYEPSSSQRRVNDDDTIQNSFHPDSEPWTPKPGVGSSRLMNLAYHINDDRYEFAEFDMRGSVSTSTWENRLAKESPNDYELDTYSWLHTLRTSLASMPAIDNKMRRPNSRTSLYFADDSLPPITPSKCKLSESAYNNNDSVAPLNNSSTNTEFATVATNRKGNVYIRWMDPMNADKWVNIAAVMNTGTYTVNEFCPVSKAHFLFTALGLRHLIVLGGDTGGSVVGIITRINLLKSCIESRTGYTIQ
jgi:CBS domain-containing protein